MSPSAYGTLEVAVGEIYYETYTNINSNAENNPMIVLHGSAGKLDHTYLLPQMLPLAHNNAITFMISVALANRQVLSSR